MRLISVVLVLFFVWGKGCVCYAAAQCPVSHICSVCLPADMRMRTEGWGGAAEEDPTPRLNLCITPAPPCAGTTTRGKRHFSNHVLFCLFNIPPPPLCRHHDVVKPSILVPQVVPAQGGYKPKKGLLWP